METFNQGIDLIVKVVGGVGVLIIAWGLVTIGSGMKDKTGPQIQQGLGQLAGGALVVLAAGLIAGVKSYIG